MKAKFLKIHPNDNVIVALENLDSGALIHVDGKDLKLLESVQAKHKFLDRDVQMDMN
ncbi:MAG: hypothetical protein AAGL29_13705 [Bacteroidota bacterium]